MRGINKVTLLGNLGKDPDWQSVEGDVSVVKFPLATTETFKDRGGRLVSQTEWHQVVLWRGLADLASKYLHKGSLVYIEGRLRTRTWDDRETGIRKTLTEVVGDNLIMLDKRQDGGGNNGNGSYRSGQESGAEMSGENARSMGEPPATAAPPPDDAEFL